MNKLSENITKMAVDYLGPAALRFLERQTMSHMNGLDFRNIEKGHLTELSRWINISGSMVIDKDKAKELSDKIRSLG